MGILDNDKVLIFSPHPDDEILGCSSIIKWASDKENKKNIVFLTNGENDLLGALCEMAYRNMEEKDSFYIGCSSLILKVQNTVKRKVFIYLFDRDKKPLKDIEVEITNEKNKCCGKTNQLGWLLLEASIVNFNPKVKVKLESEITYDNVVGLNNDFLRYYGLKRIHESYSALKSLGVKKDEIIMLGCPDGGISNINNSEDCLEALKDKLRVLLKAYEGATVIIPHVLDIDMDHCSFAKIFKSASIGMNISLYMYMIHCKEDHKLWPEPVYKDSIDNRIKLDAYMSVIKNTGSDRCESILLEKVGMTAEKKLELIKKYETQCKVDEYGFLSGFAKANEVFYKEEYI